MILAILIDKIQKGISLNEQEEYLKGLTLAEIFNITPDHKWQR